VKLALLGNVVENNKVKALEEHIKRLDLINKCKVFIKNFKIS
jgi:hypothetical protein